MNRYSVRTLVLEIAMFVAALAFVFPIIVLVSMAFRAPSDSTNPFSIPRELTLQNFVDAWTQASLPMAIVNSLLISLISVVVLIITASLASYPLARVTRKWSTFTFYGFMLGLLLPFQLGLIPLYTTFRDLGLIGSVLPLIILYVGIQLPFSIFLYTTFLRAIPADYEEAARIDGCGPLRGFLLVVFPLLRPITGTVAILNIIFIWNDFFSPLLYLSGTTSQTIPVALYSFVGQYSTQWNLIFAGLMVGLAPIVVAFFFMQKSVFQGFSGGLKG